MPFVEMPPRREPPRPGPQPIPHENRLDCPCVPCAAYRAQMPRPRMSWIAPLVGLVVVAASVGCVLLLLLAAGAINWWPF
jgi:hypothetical protein